MQIIIFIVVHVLSRRHIADELKERYIRNDKLNLLFQGAREEIPEELEKQPPKVFYKKSFS